MEVDMDVSGVHLHHHQQEMSSQTLESMLVCTKAQQAADKKPRPPEEALKCPRCDSSNTKFCYYNNYSLTQPRYFCKSCRRYWTKGGTLRNVPVGGGCRKNKRSSSTSSSTPTSSNNSSSSTAVLSKNNIIRDHHHLIQQHHHHHHQLNNHLLSGGLTHLPYDSTCTDLSLAFARLQNGHSHMGGYEHFDHNGSDHLGFLDAIRGSGVGFLDNNGNGNGNGFNHVLYNNNNLENGDLGIGLMGLTNGTSSTNHNQDHDQDQEIMNPMFQDHHHHHQETIMNNGSTSTCGAATTAAVTMTTVKQEACNMMLRPSELGGGGGGGVLWGFPWQIGGGGGGDQGTMVHEVESGRSQIGGWNGIGSTTNWHGLINSPLM